LALRVCRRFRKFKEMGQVEKQEKLKMNRERVIKRQPNSNLKRTLRNLLPLNKSEMELSPDIIVSPDIRD